MGNLDWEIDLRYKINCKDNFFSGIFAEHVFEHLTIFQGLHALKELRRILKKGGILQDFCSDLKKYIDFYCRKKLIKNLIIGTVLDLKHCGV